MSDDSCEKPDQDSILVRPSAEFQSLLILAGASKDLFTMKEVMHYLGQYIMQKELYDKTEQHIVHCSQDALGQVLGVHSFSVKEPRFFFPLIIKNLVAVKSKESPEVSQQCNGQTEGQSVSPESTRRSGEPGPSGAIEEEQEQQQEEEQQEEQQEGGRKRRHSDSFSVTSDDTLSWLGLANDTDCHSQASDIHSTVSDNFSVEFEVLSLDSEDYSDEETSLSGDDQVYEVNITEAEEDSSDEDPEITQAPPDAERTVSMEAGVPILCLICQTRPKNGCIVHGRTGHLLACYRCVKKLKKRNKLCPICREPIQSVVHTYFI